MIKKVQKRFQKLSQKNQNFQKAKNPKKILPSV